MVNFNISRQLKQYPRPLRGDPTYHFTTVHIPNQDAAELDPFFVGKFINEIGTIWEVYDQYRIHHRMEFNMSYCQPRLTNGWNRLRQFYHWNPDYNITIHFIYYKDSCFQMLFGQNQHNTTPSGFPEFHSLSTCVDEYLSFTHLITNTDITSLELVLGDDISYFIMFSSNYTEIILTGPQNHSVTCAIIQKLEINRKVKFGEGWTSFCNLNNIREGDKLQFTTDGRFEVNVLIVKKI